MIKLASVTEYIFSSLRDTKNIDIFSIQSIIQWCNNHYDETSMYHTLKVAVSTNFSFMQSF